MTEEKKKGRYRNGQQERQQNSCKQNMACTTVVVQGKSGRDQSGYGSLDSGNRDTVSKHIEGKDNLIETKTFGTNCPG